MGGLQRVPTGLDVPLAARHGARMTAEAGSLAIRGGGAWRKAGMMPSRGACAGISIDASAKRGSSPAVPNLARVSARGLAKWTGRWRCSQKLTLWFWTRRARCGWLIPFPPWRRPSACVPPGWTTGRTAPGTRSRSRCSSMSTDGQGPPVRGPVLPSTCRLPAGVSNLPMAPWSVPRAGAALLGRHRLHLTQHRGLPVGSGCGPVGGRAGRRPGATVPVETLGELSRGWYAGRLSDHWRPSSAEAKQALLRDAGLRGPFWQIHPS